MTPPAALEAAFRRIADTRMQGLPICNDALQVQAVGFRPWQGNLLGVLLTPWAMNLVLLPQTDPTYRRLRVGECQRWRLPAAALDFMAGEEPDCGSYQACSLFSPAFEFADQQTAVATAEAVMEALFRSNAPAEAAPAVRVESSRRAFLTGRPGL
jgi:[NiFe] hydrogenase assembly HybE family chaperone